MAVKKTHGRVWRAEPLMRSANGVHYYITHACAHVAAKQILTGGKNRWQSRKKSE